MELSAGTSAPESGSIRFEEEKKRLIWGTRYVDTCVITIGFLFFPLHFLGIVSFQSGIVGLIVMLVVLGMGVMARKIYADAPDPTSMYAIVNFGMLAIILQIGVLIHFSGGLASFFALSYFLVAVGCSVFVSFRNSIILNAVSALTFYSVCMLEVYGVLPRHTFVNSPFEGFRNNALFAAAYAGTLFPFLTLVSYASWFFAQRLRRTEEALDAEQKERLAELGMFSSVIAHEFKNPLGIIKGSVQVAQDEPDPKVRSQMLGNVRDEVDRLDRMVRTILDYSKPQSMDLERVDAGDIIDELLVFFSDKSGKGVTVKFDRARGDGFMIRADVEKFKQVLLNLLLNAVDVSPAGGSVEFVLRTAADSGDPLTPERVAIDVIDRGPGIGDDLKAKLFQPFFTTKTKGTGLGLAISRRIVEGHGGILSVTSAPGEGACFTILLRPAAGVSGEAP